MLLLLFAWLGAQTLATGHVPGFQAGSTTSPDHRWTISSPGADPNTEEMQTTAWLSKRGGKRHRLMRFERDLDVIWLPDRRHALLIQHTTHFAAVHLADLARARQSPDLEGQAEATLARLPPRLGSIENRRVVVVGTPERICLLFEESGPPLGPHEGGYVARRAAFAIDVPDGQLRRIPNCSGARID